MWAFNKQGSDFIARFPLNISEEDNNKLNNILEALDEQDDIQEVYSNISS